MSEINVQHTVQDFWATRPRRRRDDRKIGGVAAAIGRRYAIDPVLVRVAFVVATMFSGIGALLYLLGWLLLPAEGDRTSAAESLLGRGRSSMSSALMLVLVLLLILTSWAVFEGPASGVLALAVAVGAMFLLHQSRAALGEIPTPSSTAPETVPRGTTSEADHGSDQQGEPGTTDRPAPPAWDPLGAAPFAWDLPEPSSAPPPQPPPAQNHRSKVTPITLGLALLTGGIASAFWPALSGAQIAALLLGVVGFGLMAGSLLRGGRGLIVAAVPLALLTWVLQASPVSSFAMGDARWNPLTATQVQPRYEVSLGNGRLDLSGLQFPPGQPVTTNVAVGMGETEVILPPNVDVQLRCRAQVGNVDCLGRSDSGSLPAQVTVIDNGSDGPGGGLLELDVNAGVGNVNVERRS
ncbi:MAG: PspC domain-containing protein [Pseudonocardiaceae bacterium]